MNNLSIKWYVAVPREQSWGMNKSDVSRTFGKMVFSTPKGSHGNDIFSYMNG